ncbi:MAG: SDR family oxidoreductase [Alphaproteobacteria bacterium]
MPTILITGAGRGIGLEFARQYGGDGWTVLATLRDPAKAESLLALEGHVAVMPLDVADPASVAILAERLGGTPIDLLINNAGVYGPRSTVLGELDYPAWQTVLTVNTLGPMRVTEAFLNHLRAGAQKKIVTVSSRMGSIAESSGGAYAYRSSKAAVNSVMKGLAAELAPEGFTVALFHPGWVRTDMGGPTAAVAPADSAAGMRAVIDRLGPADSGGFFDHDGTPIPW